MKTKTYKVTCDQQTIDKLNAEMREKADKLGKIGDAKRVKAAKFIMWHRLHRDY